MFNEPRRDTCGNSNPTRPQNDKTWLLLQQMDGPMGRVGTLVSKARRTYDQACFSAAELAIRHSSQLMLVAGIGLLSAGISELATAQTQLEPGSSGLRSG